MLKWAQLIFLKKEANQFDSKLYILKAFVAVVVTYFIASHLTLVKKDIISVLFGLLLTLEPVTITGIKSGLNQIYATILGAFCTAIIILIFGINVWTIALSISATLFVCLIINWREVSPVAIFTSIYMTQFIQLDAAGVPSVFLTFKLRILALGIGVFSAILFNFLFSLFSYKKMERKRIAYTLSTLSGHLAKIYEGLLSKQLTIIQQEKANLPQTFNGIDWLASLIKDKEKEAALLNKFKIRSNYLTLTQLESLLGSIRSLNHLTYDTAYVLCDTGIETFSEKSRTSYLELLQKAIHKLNTLSVFFEKPSELLKDREILDTHLNMNSINASTDRLNTNLTQINFLLDSMVEKLHA